MVYDFNDFYNSLMIKNQLLSVDLETLKNEYKDMEKYYQFVDIISVISAIDSCFFMLDNSLIERAESIIGVNRFNVTDVHVHRVINSIIDYFNEIKSLNKGIKNSLLFQYLSYHEDCRKTKINDERRLGEHLIYDGIALRAICEDEMDRIKDKDDNFFLSSINYFIDVVPEIFEDEDIRGRVDNKLLDIRNRNKGLFNKIRIKEKETATNLLKTVKKGE